MKSFFAIRSKFKVALLLLVIVTVILIAALLERKFFTDVNTSSASIYNDRLIPATAIFHICDNVYQQQNLYEKTRTQADAQAMLHTRLQALKSNNDSIIKAFEETYLTPAEESYLDQLNTHLNEYYKLKGYAINASETTSNSKLRASFEQIRNDLHQLSAIQTQVGGDLFTETKNNVARAHLITNLQIVAAIILSIICQVLILTSKSIKSPIAQRHDLN